jgi:hypothetical protein
LGTHDWAETIGAADWDTVGVAVVLVEEPLVVAALEPSVAELLAVPVDAVPALTAVATTGVAAAAAAIEPLSAPNPITLAVTDASFSRARRRLAAASRCARSSVISFSFIRISYC